MEENMKKIAFQVISILIIGVLIYCTGARTVLAKNSLSSNLDSINGSIEDKKNQQKEVEIEKKTVMEEVQDLIYQISDYESQIVALDKEIDTLEDKIAQEEENLIQEEKNYEKLNKDTQERITAVYEAGETTLLDMLLGSSSLIDFISNYYLASLITEADSQMLEEIEKKKNQIAAEKEALENNKQKVEETKKNKENTTKALNQAKKMKNEMAEELSSQEKQLQAEIEEFETEKKKIEEELRRIAEEEAKKNQGNNVTANPSTAGYICPIPGTSKNSITCGFYGYSGHGGVDFGGHYGEAIVAVKSGTVIKSKTTYGSIRNYDANGNYIGSYSSYGEYIIINHHDGTMTLYAHGKPGSRLVREGETVRQGQQIMTVGNTGNVFPRPSPSNPRGGAHLHFEVRVNGSRVNPYAYLP